MSTSVAHRLGYDLVLVSAQRVATTGEGSFDFANLGPASRCSWCPVDGTHSCSASRSSGRDAPPGHAPSGSGDDHR